MRGAVDQATPAKHAAVAKPLSHGNPPFPENGAASQLNRIRRNQRSARGGRHSTAPSSTRAAPDTRQSLLRRATGRTSPLDRGLATDPNRGKQAVTIPVRRSIAKICCRKVSIWLHQEGNNAKRPKKAVSCQRHPSPGAAEKPNADLQGGDRDSSLPRNDNSAPKNAPLPVAMSLLSRWVAHTPRRSGRTNNWSTPMQWKSQSCRIPRLRSYRITPSVCHAFQKAHHARDELTAGLPPRSRAWKAASY